MTQLEKFQEAYDLLIKFSNQTFNYVNKQNIAEYCEGQAVAYETAAAVLIDLAENLGIPIKERMTDLSKFKEQEAEKSNDDDRDRPTVNMLDY